MVVLVQICWILGTQESLYISEFLAGSTNDIRNSCPWAFLPVIMRLCLLWTRHAWLLRTAASSSDWLLKNPITTFLTKACLFTQAIHNTHVWISTVNSTVQTSVTSVTSFWSPPNSPVMVLSPALPWQHILMLMAPQGAPGCAWKGNPTDSTAMILKLAIHWKYDSQKSLMSSEIRGHQHLQTTYSVSYGFNMQGHLAWGDSPK